MLSPELQRVLKIREYCDDIAKTVDRYGASFETFQADSDYRYSVSFCILQIGEIAGGLSEGFRRASADRIPWASIRGMRNIVAHGYDSIRLDIVWKVVNEDIPALRAFCEEELAKGRE